ncbi:MAG: hypothetical protein LW823_04200 [Rickettsiales bacterium]|jgi:hypothetical protein|nr:hypothetical protein [Rickettsiales bacterium]
MSRALIIISASLFSLGVIAAGGHYFVWQQHANHAKEQVEAAIAKINADKPMISYASLTTSGYPSRIAVTLENPKFSGRVDEWLQAVAQAGNTNTLEHQQRKTAIESLPEWITDTSINGRIVLSSNLLADRYAITVSGPLTSTNQIAGFSETSASEPQGDSHCDITVTHKESLFERLQELLKNEPTTMGDFTSIDCNIPATRYVSNSGEVLTSSNGASLRVNTAAELEQTHKLDVMLMLRDMEVTEAGDKLIEMYMRTLMPEMNYSNRWSIYGKQTTELDFRYSGPKDFRQMTKNQPIDIALNKFAIRNDVYQTDFSFLMSNANDKGMQQSKLNFQAKSTFAESYQTILNDVLKDMSKEILEHPQPNRDLSRFTPENLVEILTPAVPNFASLGTLTQTIDLNYSGNDSFTEGNATLTQLEFSATPYGITGKGNAKLTGGQMMPSGALDLECRQCSLMLDDIAGYTTRLRQALMTIDPSMANDFPVSPETISKLKGFLSALAAQGNDASWRFAIISDASTGPSVNGKSIMDVMALYSQHMADIDQP